MYSVFCVWPRIALDREDASSMVTAGATANTTEGNGRASRESGLLCSHSQGESIALASRDKTRIAPQPLGLHTI